MPPQIKLFTILSIVLILSLYFIIGLGVESGKSGSEWNPSSFNKLGHLKIGHSPFLKKQPPSPQFVAPAPEIKKSIFRPSPSLGNFQEDLNVEEGGAQTPPKVINIFPDSSFEPMSFNEIHQNDIKERDYENIEIWRQQVGSKEFVPHGANSIPQGWHQAWPPQRHHSGHEKGGGWHQKQKGWTSEPATSSYIERIKKVTGIKGGIILGIIGILALVQTLIVTCGNLWILLTLSKSLTLTPLTGKSLASWILGPILPYLIDMSYFWGFANSIISFFA